MASARETKNTKGDMGTTKEKNRMTWEEERGKEQIVRWLKWFMVYMGQPRCNVRNVQEPPRRLGHESQGFVLMNDPISRSVLSNVERGTEGVVRDRNE